MIPLMPTKIDSTNGILNFHHDSASRPECCDSFFLHLDSPALRRASLLQKMDSRAFQRDTPGAPGESLARAWDSSGRIRES
jgi:hypothetical protein